jgi:excisionase family DNA binding protein
MRGRNSYMECLLTPQQAGAYLGVHQKTAIRMARQGELPGMRVRKHWRFRRSDLESWAEQQVKSGPPARTE